MKQNLKYNQKGFTLIELLVVISIMGIMGTLLVVNFNSTRSRRDLTLSSNELVTNLRKAQSYALSARDVSTNVPAKYYVMQFDLSSAPNQYKLLAVDNNYTATPTVIETYNLPTDVFLDISNSSFTQPIGSGFPANPNCLQIMFGLPFGRIYMVGSSGKTCNNNFIQTAKDPSAMATLTNSEALINLRSTTLDPNYKGQVYYNKTIEVNGLSGTISIQ